MVVFVSRSYRGDQGLQTLPLGADIFGGIDHRPCGAAAVELRGGNQNTVLVPPAVYLTDLFPQQLTSLITLNTAEVLRF